MCLPGNAVSTLLDSFPTLSGKVLVVPHLVRAMLSVINLALGTGVCGSLPCHVASFAFSLAQVQSSLSLSGGNHIAVILSHFLLSFAMDL